MTCKIIPLKWIPSSEIEKLLSEGNHAGEFIHPLWQLYSSGAARWKLRSFRGDGNETLLAFLVCGRLAGCARVTRQPKHMENGKIGFYLRPSFRKQKFAPVMIRLLEGWCQNHGIDGLTAVADASNTASIRALFAAGWRKSGKEYSWSHGRTGIELKPAKCFS